MFNNNRLSLARKRRGLSARALAQHVGLSSVHLSRLERSPSEPNKDTIIRLAETLRFPIDFFYADDVEDLDEEAVSFRSLSKMTAKERAAAISVGQLGIELNKWVEERFLLPEADLPDMEGEDPENAAYLLRQQWGIGEQPIGNLIGLLETKGVRFFYLPENIETVDAFSFWRNGRPYIFMNKHKTAERNIFDIAHELGHLILHQRPYENKRIMEKEANLLGSAFTMPKNDVRARMPRFITADVIIKAKIRWRVSALALTYRLHRLGLLSEWQYTSLCIELGKRGYRTGEPNGIEKEKSIIWGKVLKKLWNEKTTKSEIAQENLIFLDELEGLIGEMAEISSPTQFQGKSYLNIV